MSPGLRYSSTSAEDVVATSSDMHVGGKSADAHTQGVDCGYDSHTQACWVGEFRHMVSVAVLKIAAFPIGFAHVPEAVRKLTQLGESGGG